ncbi:hypothetical protein CYMTET_51383 [Cymbomonas tetramitiformis]|uniref:Uncharacterized protein n=1 Tax=Cymbomonas tetramitiformis TaxID=36881 RepID=A0AAE0ES73_9CHLO|nr:hypothetical protein CYMTET_51383 [Cymbomonas tetramitiformis]
MKTGEDTIVAEGKADKDQDAKKKLADQAAANSLLEKSAQGLATREVARKTGKREYAKLNNNLSQLENNELSDSKTKARGSSGSFSASLDSFMQERKAAREAKEKDKAKRYELKERELKLKEEQWQLELQERRLRLAREELDLEERRAKQA